MKPPFVEARKLLPRLFKVFNRLRRYCQCGMAQLDVTPMMTKGRNTLPTPFEHILQQTNKKPLGSFPLCTFPVT